MNNINMVKANSNKYTMKHSLDLRMSSTKGKVQNTMKKPRKSKISATTNLEDNSDQNRTSSLVQRVFLYMQPQSISYPVDDIPSGRVEIDVEHHHNTITTLSDYFMPRNIIYVDQFQQTKQTFSITIEQDSLEDITVLSDSPVMLTLYVHAPRKSIISVVSENQEQNNKIGEGEVAERLPVAQGHIDILECFKKTRCRSYETVYLYPLKSFSQILTCKTEWKIYSLHPLLKNLSFSNVLFITMGSLYNIEEELLNKSEHLTAKLSLISSVGSEINKFFICKFTKFQKDIICNQNLSVNWESLKTINEYESNCSMGIATEARLSLSDLFKNKLCTENVEFNFDQININEDFALICNSMHRYILTEQIQKALEEVLSTNQYQIILEIYSDSDEKQVLLQGILDLSIFMYPDVKFCSYCIELKPPFQIPKSPKKEESKSARSKRKGRAISNAEMLSIKEEKTPFAILNICVNQPITNPAENISDRANIKLKHKDYEQCKGPLSANVPQVSLHAQCEENYKAFDELLREIMDYIVRNKIKSINDEKEFFCNELSNITNKIMRLIACDFNIRMPTKTNIEFTNLLTTVYRDLLLRIYTNIKKCGTASIENFILTTDTLQNAIITNVSIAKCMYEVGNSEIANYYMDKLRSEHFDNTMLKFYLFLYDVEKERFDSVQNYLDLSLDDKDFEAESFTKIIQIYVNYKRQLQDPIDTHTPDELLINALTDYSLGHKDDSLTGWILLYCLYKRYNYKPGMSYCRWKYENLYNERFVDLEFIPTTCWELYLPYTIKLKSLKGKHFVKVFEKLLSLGLYEFAELVFRDVADECLEVERYFILNTFAIFQQTDKKKLSTKTFAVDKLENAKHKRATLLQVNGNLEYYRDPVSTNSYKFYREIVQLEDFEDFFLYELALLRYAYRKMDDKEYEEAAKAFDLCCNGKTNCIAGVIGKGKACYFLGRLKEAEKYFAQGTRYGIYMPNTWAYLALTNLKLGNNYNALECWKYARLNPDTEIHSEVLSELNKINHRDINLYVDIPNKL